MRLFGTQDELWRQLITPAIAADLARIEHVRGKMFPYQYAALYDLARKYDGGQILEIGALAGRATLIMSSAAPRACIVSLEPHHSDVVRRNTLERKNVTVIKTYSFQYLKKNRAVWDMVFVDGNHTRVKQDVPWFDRLRVGGLILFHDYTPDDAARSRCPPVYAAVNDMAGSLGRTPDVLIVDTEKVGMAGFYRRKGETLIRTRGRC